MTTVCRRSQKGIPLAQVRVEKLVMDTKVLIPFQQNVTALLESIEDCLTKGRTIASLILLYSGIDCISALESGRANRSTFKKWVSDYILRKTPLPCTASDLYAARCGILHTLSAESELSRQRKARPIVYAWGNAKPERLARTAAVLKRQDCIIHIRELVDGFRRGLADYLEEILRDQKRILRVQKTAGLWFTNVSTETVDTFLKLHATGP